MLLPQTLTAAIALTMFAVIAFRMEANTEGFVFSFFSLFAWIALVSEFFLLYDSIIDKWLSKDRSVIAATWFLLSLLLSFMLTPDKHLDWSTAIVMLSLFAVIFLLPYMVCMVYGRHISSFLLRLWMINSRRKIERVPCPKQRRHRLSSGTSRRPRTHRHNTRNRLPECSARQRASVRDSTHTTSSISKGIDSVS